VTSLAPLENQLILELGYQTPASRYPGSSKWLLRPSSLLTTRSAGPGARSACRIYLDEHEQDPVHEPTERHDLCVGPNRLYCHYCPYACCRPHQPCLARRRHRLWERLVRAGDVAVGDKDTKAEALAAALASKNVTNPDSGADRAAVEIVPAKPSHPTAHAVHA
jgi:hypothetical protein